MSTIKQIEACTNRLALVDHDNAADFSTATPRQAQGAIQLAKIYRLIHIGY